MVNPLNAGVVILLLLYPVLIYFGLNYFSPAQLGLFFLILFIIRILVTRTKSRAARWQLIFAVVIGGTLAILTAIFDSREYLLWYPVGMSVAFFIIFTASLIFPPTVIEQLGRSYNKNFPEAAVSYTRKVTIIWATFFGLNIFVAGWTVLYASLETWTLYNGLISYMIIGVLVGAEILIRKFVVQK